jgi:hypothetical protein
MIEMELFEIRIDETSSEQVIVLKEMNGERLLPIVIGMFEAQSIHVKINNVQLPRPLTHDLLGRVIDALGGTLQRIVVNDLEQNTFYARLVLQSNNGEIEVDSRPSDAIALAIRSEVPIFVEEVVFDKLSSS